MEQKFEVRCRGIIVHEGKMLVVTHTGKEEFIVLPGGHLEWGEDVKTALKRELIEELGVEPVIGDLLYVHTFTQDNGVQPIEFFFEIKNPADYLDLADKERTHAHELERIDFVAQDEDRKFRPQLLWQDFVAGNLLSHETLFIGEDLY